jgi:hypothetical protein
MSSSILHLCQESIAAAAKNLERPQKRTAFVGAFGNHSLWQGREIVSWKISDGIKRIKKKNEDEEVATELHGVFQSEDLTNILHKAQNLISNLIKKAKDLGGSAKALNTARTSKEARLSTDIVTRLLAVTSISSPSAKEAQASQELVNPVFAAIFEASYSQAVICNYLEACPTLAQLRKNLAWLMDPTKTTFTLVPKDKTHEVKTVSGWFFADGIGLDSPPEFAPLEFNNPADHLRQRKLTAGIQQSRHDYNCLFRSLLMNPLLKTGRTGNGINLIDRRCLGALQLFAQASSSY